MQTICKKTCYFEPIFKNICATNNNLVLDKTSIIISNEFNTAESLDWIKFNDEEYPISSNYFNSFQYSKTDDVKPVFVMFKREEQIIGTAYFQIINFKPNEFSNYGVEINKGFDKLKNGMLKTALSPFSWKILVSGNMFFTANNGFNFNGNVAVKDRIELIQQAILQIKKHPNNNFQGVLISDLSADHNQKAKFLETYNYSNFPVDPCLSFKIEDNWKTFDDYKNALKSKYRVRTNKVLKDSGSLELFEINIANIDQYEQNIFELYEQVLNKADFKMGTVGKNYFKSLLKNNNSQFKIMGFKTENKLQGFISLAHNKEELIVHFIGINYDLNREIKIYNRILLECIEYGINHNFKKINFGRTANEIKSTLGAKPIEMFCYVKHFNPLINNLVVKPVNKILKPKTWQERNPFK